jgi:hypothetical protein
LTDASVRLMPRRVRTGSSTAISATLSCSRRRDAGFDGLTNARLVKVPRAAASPAASKQQVATLVVASVVGTGQNGAHSKQLLAAARRELGAARIAFDAPLRAHGTVDAERGAGRRCMFEFAERQILDVHGSGVLDARKSARRRQRLARRL